MTSEERQALLRRLKELHAEAKRMTPEQARARLEEEAQRDRRQLEGDPA